MSAPRRSGRGRRAGWSSAQAIACCLGICIASAAPALAYDVKTHHFDAQRTGWDPLEKVLKVSTVSGGSFGQQWNTPLSDPSERVDAEPLVATQVTMPDQTIHDVVYVASESNNVYAIDATTGVILKSVNLGTPVPRTALPGYCKSSGYSNGIISTPVLSASMVLKDSTGQSLPPGALWLIAYHYENNTPIYRLHVLDLSTLADKLPPVTVQASGKLLDGTTFNFDARHNKQRPALLFANGFIYAAFASHCDIEANVTRGWVMGWNAASLKPISRDELTNKLLPGPDRLLSAIWMSGAGPAATLATPGNPSQSIFFITGNSDKSGATYDSVNNLSESVVSMDPGLHRVQSFFTPYNVADLDMGDRDFSGGGITVLPPQPGSYPHLGVAAGKDSKMFLLNLDDLGGYTPGGPDRVLGTYPIGWCQCQPAYFVGSDGIARIVSSGGGSSGSITNPHPSVPQVMVWKLDTSGSVPQLTLETQSAVLNSGQRGGFFTSVSSNGTKPGTAVIWAVTHPLDPVNPNNPTGADLTLHAFNPADMSEIFTATAGTWPDIQTANVVPTVANGHVYVASFGQLRSFGVNPPAQAAARSLARGGAGVVATASRVDDPALGPNEHQLSGMIKRVDGMMFAMEDRNGRLVSVDMTEGVQADHAVQPSVGDAVQVRGKYGRDGTLQANVVIYTGDSSRFWEADH